MLVLHWPAQLNPGQINYYAVVQQHKPIMVFFSQCIHASIVWSWKAVNRCLSCKVFFCKTTQLKFQTSQSSNLVSSYLVRLWDQDTFLTIADMFVPDQTAQLTCLICHSHKCSPRLACADNTPLLWYFSVQESLFLTKINFAESVVFY